MISILIVDDEPLIRETLAGMLEKRYHGRFHVTLAGDGRQALEYASMLPVRLILADIKMPVLSGLEMLDQLRGLRRDCEVIFISGYDDYAFVRQAMKLGAADYLLKPIVEEELTGQIDSFLKREEVRRAEQPPTPAASAVVFVVKKGSKIFSRILSSMPMPLSRRWINNLSACRSSRICNLASNGFCAYFFAKA